MRGSFTVSDFRRTVSTLELNALGASGVLNPRLNFYGEASLMPEVKEVRLEVSLRLEYRNELIGESKPLRKTIDQNGKEVSFEIVTSQRLLRHITDGLPSSQSSVQIDARLQGVGWYCLKPIDESANGYQTGDDPEPGEWKYFELRYEKQYINMQRSEWYGTVLTQTKGEQYRFLEIALPRSDSTLAQEWDKTVELLQKAERAYAIGADAAVFSNLHGAREALPGTIQKICDGIHDPRKKKAVDDLLAKVGTYLHSGRHVSQEGPEEGTFPVDHMDAAFAIDLMRTVLSHLSLILSTERDRASRQ
jgi:hypothetical protein